jgi:hypothetical protein
MYWLVSTGCFVASEPPNYIRPVFDHSVLNFSTSTAGSVNGADCFGAW